MPERKICVNIERHAFQHENETTRVIMSCQLNALHMDFPRCFFVCTTLYTKYIQCTFHVVHVVSPSFVSRKWNKTPANFERIKIKIKVNQRIFPTSFPTCSHYNFGLLKFTSAKFFSLRLIPIISIHATEKTQKKRKQEKQRAFSPLVCAKKDAIRFMLLLVSKYPWIFSVEWKNVRFSASLKRKYQVAFVAGENVALWIDKGKSMYERLWRRVANEIKMNCGEHLLRKHYSTQSRCKAASTEHWTLKIYIIHTMPWMIYDYILYGIISILI